MAVLTTRERVLSIVVLCAVLAYQIYVVVLAVWQAPTFRTLFAGIGGPLPLMTRSFLAFYRYWWIATVLLAALSFDVLRRRDPPLWYFAATVVATAATALGMHAWMHEAVYAPLFEILRRVG